MKRASYLQEIRTMRFTQSYEGWQSGRLTQAQAAEILGVCERSFRRYVDRYEDGGGLQALSDRRLNQASRGKRSADRRNPGLSLAGRPADLGSRRPHGDKSRLRADGRTLHVRKTSKAEPALMRIYQALGITASAGGIKKLIV